MVNLEHRTAVLEETRLIVVEALREGDGVRAVSLAKVIALNYPKSGIAEAEIAEAIKQACIEAGVRIETSLHLLNLSKASRRLDSHLGPSRSVCD